MTMPLEDNDSFLGYGLSLLVFFKYCDILLAYASQMIYPF